jgi:arabinofuranosyltransferase
VPIVAPEKTATGPNLSTTDGETAPASRLLIGLLLSPSFLFGLVFLGRTRGVSPEGSLRWVLFDDAMISMSYARTLAQTGELVWFPGADRVEGITNPLWTLYMALLHLLDLPTNAIVLAVALTGLLCVLAASLVTYHIACALTTSRTLCLSAMVVSSFTYSFMHWSVRGMEVGPVTLATVGAILLAIKVKNGRTKAFVGLCLVLAAGVALRFDFVVVAGVVSIWLVVVMTGLRGKAIYGVGAGVVAATTAIAITAGRYFYYGEIFPNTYTLKVTGVSVGDKLARGFDADVKIVAFLLLVLVGAAAIQLSRSDAFRDRQVMWILLATTAATVAYSTYVGGDAWEFFPNRYVIPGLITGNVVAVVGVGQVLTQRSTSRFLPAVFVAVLTLTTSSAAGYVNWVSSKGLYVNMDHAVSDWATTLRTENITAKDAVLAVMVAGSSQYYSHLPAVDILGKNDPVVANSVPRSAFLPGHDRWDINHTVLGLRPDIVTNLPAVTEDEWTKILALYQPYCLDYLGQDGKSVKGMLVLKGSARVNTNKLRPCVQDRPDKRYGWYLEQ